MRGDRFDWHREVFPIGLDAKQLFGSRVYKWEFRSKNLPTKLYIGQCQEFKARLDQYRAAKMDGSSTEARFRREAQKYEDAGGTVDLFFLDLGTPISINGKPVKKLTLGETAVRLMLESIAIISALAADIEILNQSKGNWYKEQISELLIQKGLDLKSRQEVLKLIGFDE